MHKTVTILLLTAAAAAFSVRLEANDQTPQFDKAPIIAADAKLLTGPPRWAKSKKRWHQRAAAVSLIHSTRQHKNFEQIQRITEMLLPSDDDMV